MALLGGATMLVTQCPVCGTGFKVTLEELSIAEGELQCGQCQAYFNAEDQPKFSDESSAELYSAESEVDADADVFAADVVITEVKVEESLVSPVKTAGGVDAIDEIDIHEMSRDSTELNENLHQPESSVSGEEATSKSDDIKRFRLLRSSEAKQLLHNWVDYFWGLMLLILLFTQLMWIFEARLYEMPKLYGLAERYCEFSGCQLDRFKDIALIKLDEVNMTPWRDGRADISARLTNTGPYDQDLPKVLFTLRDGVGRVLGARTLEGQKDYWVTDRQSLMIEAGKVARIKFVVFEDDAFGAAVSYQMELVNTL